LTYKYKPCKWKPVAGKLYQVYQHSGFIFNDKPIIKYDYHPFYPRNVRIGYHDIFLYLGGVGGRQTVPGHFVAFKILWKDKIGWLIYPEQEYQNDYIVEPIRL